MAHVCVCRHTCVDGVTTGPVRELGACIRSPGLVSGISAPMHARSSQTTCHHLTQHTASPQQPVCQNNSDCATFYRALCLWPPIATFVQVRHPRRRDGAVVPVRHGLWLFRGVGGFAFVVAAPCVPLVFNAQFCVCACRDLRPLGTLLAGPLFAVDRAPCNSLSVYTSGHI